MRFPFLRHFRAALLLALVGSFTSSGALGATPSFLCSKAKTWVEKTICASDELSTLDLDLAVTYARMLKVLAPDAEATLTAEQRKWWAARAACQKEAEPSGCLQGRYETRIANLTSRPEYPGDQPRPREEFTEALIKEAGKGWSQHMSLYMKAIRSCMTKPAARPRAVLSVWTEEEGELVLMRLRGAGGEDLVCYSKRDGSQTSMRPREPVETLPAEGPILWLGSGPAPKGACGKPVQVLDTDDTPVGWVAEANC